ncbi:DUF885 family protein [Rubripirellula obstinata]|nr:DUF885 family protein [Rubripirellula obstinata]
MTVPKTLAAILFSTLLAMLCWIGLDGSTAMAAETINLQIKPRWSDDGNFWFVRQTEDGEREVVDVNVDDGSMKVRKDGRLTDRPAGLIGGPIPKSILENIDDTEIKFVNKTEQPVTTFWITSSGEQVQYATIQPGKTSAQHTFVGHAWIVKGKNGDFYGSIVAEGLGGRAVAKEVFPLVEAKRFKKRSSARGRSQRPMLEAKGWQLRVDDGQLQKRSKDADSSSWDSIDSVNSLVGEDCSLLTPRVSPDERYLVMWKKTAAEKTLVATIESSPKGGGLAVLRQRPYPLPGDDFDQFELIVCDTEDWQPISLDTPVFDFGRPSIRFHGDHDLLIEKVDRGHQRFRLFRINPDSKTVTTPIDEQTDTFIWTAHGPFRRPVTYLNDADHVIYSSEKSGWRHLYWVDLSGEAEPTAITSGEFVVRELIHVDEENQTVDIVISGYHDDQDPYHRHLARASFDGQNFDVLTDGDGEHQWSFSPNRDHVVVSYSRVDSPPIHELRNANDGQLLATLSKAKRIADPGETLSQLPTVFSAKGRDGETDIWGFITFPDDYDPSSGKKYPVIESIYAGPHSSHVPKRFRGSPPYKDLNDLGFIVVKIDGMGTANRSKAFHDVCWHNLKDAGFPDRIAWMKAAAEKFPGMDLTRVGIYGTSAGGQNAMGALLFHGDFYKAAMGSCGCHDNRMDKASWNEQWMGYPVGPHYAQSSNVDNAHRLQGDLLLIVGELDTNVPPESTLRVVDALIKADKDFDFLMIPGMGHSGGGDYGWRRTKEFFCRSLMPEMGKPESETSAAVQPESKQSSASEKKKSPSSVLNPSVLKPSVLNFSVPTPQQLALTPPESVWQKRQTRFQADWGSLSRKLPTRLSPHRLTQLNHFLSEWEKRLADSSDSDPILDELRVEVGELRGQLDADAVAAMDVIDRAAVMGQIVERCDWFRRGKPLDYPALAATMGEWGESLKSLSPEKARVSKPLAKNLAQQFRSWNTFYAKYDPSFDWWCADVATDASKQLAAWAKQQSAEIPKHESLAIADAWQSVAALNDASEFPKMTSSQMLPPVTVANEKPGGEPEAIFANILRDYQTGLAELEKDASRKQGFLTQWQDSLTKMQRKDVEFSRWSVSDQVDYHLILRDIETRLARIDFDKSSSSVVRSSDGSGIIGIAVGRERLLTELRAEFIDATPERLIEMAEQGLEECHREMKELARKMGHGDDWLAAVDAMKNVHVAPGKQPELIDQTAQDSIDFIRDNQWLTIDPLAQSSWRMQMMSPQRQRVNPFFTGGEVISISFPTAEMNASEKKQSMRGNNIPFVRATVHHELIPGHHLQHFQMARHATHRQGFSTPFWLEGWAVYWEFLLYESGFADEPVFGASPEAQKLGFLVWRAHRYARIIFSLRFHLRQMSPDQCIDFLVANVGFDRRNSTAEVRRSVGPDYPPLYQAAYMIGALQLRELSQEWVSQGRPLIEFHDGVMQHGSLPIALVKPLLWNTSLEREQAPAMQFPQ